MPEYLAPGVYVEEISNGVKPIEGVGTSTAGFLGMTERGPKSSQVITGWNFNGFTVVIFQLNLTYALKDFF
jgi:phage tail sheath protein FI